MNTLLRHLLAAACLLSGLRAFADESAGASPEAAKAAALAWLKLIDDEQYVPSWKGASSRLQASFTEQRWTGIMEQVRKPLGMPESREFKTASFTHEQPRTPKGDFWVLEFATAYEGTSAIETLVMLLEPDGKWRAYSYRIGQGG